MLALITGASNGIGRKFAEILSKDYNCDIIAVARNEEKLLSLKENLKTNCEIIPMDLSIKENCFKLYNLTKDKNIDILINNAGFGNFGEFEKTNLNTDLNMIDLNIKALHILTKLFLPDLKSKNKSYIINVSSSAGFIAGGPLLSTYYASKAYVLSLTYAINEEIKRSGSNLHVCALCPGPVKTGFNKRANVEFSIKGMDSHKVAKYALKQMFKGKVVIIPGMLIKLVKFVTHLIPDKLTVKFCYYMQNKKRDN